MFKNQNKILLYSAIIILLLICSAYLVFGKYTIKMFYHGDFINILNVPSELAKEKNIDTVISLANVGMIIFSILIIVILFVYKFSDKLSIILKKIFMKINNEDYIERVFNWCILIGCSWACFYSLLYQGYQGDWYVIEDLMNYNGASPFQQRILFILFAKILRWVFPKLTYIQSYCISQIIPIVLAFYFIKKWAELFIKNNYSFIAQLILLAMLIPTITYYTFYDFGIIFFFTLCLYLLFKEHFSAYYIMFAIGILNHEIILFMIFLYISMYLKEDVLWNKVWIPVLFQIIIFVVVRVIQFKLLPGTDLTASGRIWINLNYIVYRPYTLINSFVTISVWYIFSLFGLKYAPQKLKKCVLLFPLLIIMTLFVGQLNELRQFDAYIPVAIALIMCLIDALNVKTYGDSRESR
jgi:hypothetical protein